MVTPAELNELIELSQMAKDEILGDAAHPAAHGTDASVSIEEVSPAELHSRTVPAVQPESSEIFTESQEEILPYEISMQFSPFHTGASPNLSDHNRAMQMAIAKTLHRTPSVFNDSSEDSDNRDHAEISKAHGMAGMDSAESAYDDTFITKHIPSFADLLGGRNAFSGRPIAKTCVNGEIDRPQLGKTTAVDTTRPRIKMGPGVDPKAVTQQDWEDYKLFKAQRGF